jgi:hypothetical protein
LHRSQKIFRLLISRFLFKVAAQAPELKELLEKSGARGTNSHGLRGQNMERLW